MAVKNRVPTETSRDEIASASSSESVNRERNSVTMDCLFATSVLRIKTFSKMTHLRQAESGDIPLLPQATRAVQQVVARLACLRQLSLCLCAPQPHIAYLRLEHVQVLRVALVSSAYSLNAQSSGRYTHLVHVPERVQELAATLREPPLDVCP